MKVRIWERAGDMTQRAAIVFGSNGEIQDLRLSYLWNLEAGKYANREGLDYDVARRQYVAQQLQERGDRLLIPMAPKDREHIKGLLRSFLEQHQNQENKELEVVTGYESEK